MTSTGKAIASSLLFAAVMSAQPAAAQNALVLSGGGARGLAHIGVIDYLREHGYDADLVVGTSIGAVVGALYAAGYEPDDIERRVSTVRWSEMFHSTPVVVGPDRTVRVPALAFDLNVGSLRASRGFFGQWRVNRALASLLFEANARSRGNFDSLARRYRAVAADLRTGETVVLDSGDVARAVRASMAFPGFFAPVHWGNRVLTDGGITDNFPVTTARKLGASFIIGVDVSKATDEIESQSPFSVIDRSLRLLQQNLQRSDQPPDVLVAPVISDEYFGPSFPEDPRPVIKLGYDAARRDVAKHSAVPATASRARRPLPQRFSSLIVEAPDSALAALARHVYAGVVPGPYNHDAITAASDRLYTTGLFEAVWPRVASDTSSAPALIVRLEPPPRVALTAAAHFENDRGGRAWASIDQHSRLGSLPAVYSLSGAAGSLERWAAASARMYLLTRSALAWSVGAHVLERGVRFFEDDAISVEEVFRAGGWVGLESPHILRERLLTLVARVEWIDLEGSGNGVAYGPLLRYSAVAGEVRPVGVPLLFEVERRWGSLAYTQVVLRGSRTFGRRGPLAALVLDLRGVSTGAPIDVRPSLGDDHAIPGLRWGESRGRVRVVTGADVALPLKTTYVRLRARTGAIGDKPDEWDAERWITGGQIGFVMRTPLGNLEAGYAVATHTDGRFDVSIGRNF